MLKKHLGTHCGQVHELCICFRHHAAQGAAGLLQRLRVSDAQPGKQVRAQDVCARRQPGAIEDWSAKSRGEVRSTQAHLLA